MDFAEILLLLFCLICVIGGPRWGGKRRKPTHIDP